jgi:hypothetical protein
MIRRSDITVADSLGTPEPGVYITVKKLDGTLAALLTDSGAPMGNPLVSDTGGVFYYNIADSAAGTYTEEYRLSLSDSPRTIRAIALTADPSTSALRRAVIVLSYGQSLTGDLSPAVSTSEIANTYTFIGGYNKENFPDWSNSAGELTQNTANLSDVVAYAPGATNENLFSGLATKLVQSEDVDALFVFRATLGGQSLKQLRSGTNNFRDFANGACAAVYHMERLGYAVDPATVFIQGQADADLLDDGGGATTVSTTAEWKSGMTKLHASFAEAWRVATGRPISPPTYLVPMLSGSGGGQYTSAGIQNVVEAQRQAVRDVAGVRWGPGYSQFANLFNTDHVHPLGQAVRYHAEALGLVMLMDSFSPPQMTAISAIDGTHTDVTFDQDVVIDGTLSEASGYADAKYGFQLTIGATYYAVSAVAQTSARVFRLTHANCSTSGRAVLNGLMFYASSGPAATYMPRTHVRSTVSIGTAVDGTILYNFSIAQVQA